MSEFTAIRSFLLAGLTLLASATAQAVELITVEDECRGRQLLLKGAIEPGDYERLVARMVELTTREALPAVQDPELLWTVRLDSSGGDLEEAMRMGRFLRDALAVTDVGYRMAPRPDGVWDFERDGEVVCLEGNDRLAGCSESLAAAECSGACLLVWLGGADRYANEGRLGTHGLAGNEQVIAYLREMGVEDPVAAEVVIDGSAGDGWLPWRTRHALSQRAPALAGLLADCPAPLSREESFESVIAPSAATRDALMDRADAHRLCRRQRLGEHRAALGATVAAAPAR